MTVRRVRYTSPTQTEAERTLLQVCTLSWWPSMYSYCSMSGREMAREPTTKKVDFCLTSSR